MFKVDNEHSWSYTKHKLFHECERKYFLHYFGSKINTENNSFIFTLHNINKTISSKTWINNLFIKALQTTFISTHKVNEKQFNSLLRKNIFTLLCKGKTQINEQSVFINEIIQTNISIETVLNNAKACLNDISEIFLNSKIIYELINIPVQAKQNTSKPLSFRFDNFIIWNSPTIAWLNKGNLYSLNIYIENSFDSFNLMDWDFISTINSLSWQNKLKLPKEKIETITLFINTNDKTSINIYGKKNQNETLKLIKKSYSEIISRQTSDRKAFKDNFLKTGNRKKCNNCKYNNFCSQN